MLVEMMVKVLERLGPLLLLGTGRLDQDVINKDDGDLGDLAEALVVSSFLKQSLHTAGLLPRLGSVSNWDWS